jgi:Na+/H+-dicarboxylate symporter
MTELQNFLALSYDEPGSPEPRSQRTTQQPCVATKSPGGTAQILVTLYAIAAGIHMTFGQQLLMMLTLILSSKGVACVPRASLIVLLGTVATFGLPVEPVVMLLGIDELMEMGRSATNQIGNCLAAVVIAKSEGEFQLTPEELAPVDTARAS